MKIYPHHPLYHTPLPKSKKTFFATQKWLRVLKLLLVLIDRVLFRVHSDRVLFKFHSDRVLLRIFIYRVLFEPLVIGSWSGSSKILLLGHQCSFSDMPLFLYQNMLLLYLLKANVLFYIIFLKRGSPVIISSEKNEELIAWYKRKV